MEHFTESNYVNQIKVNQLNSIDINNLINGNTVNGFGNQDWLSKSDSDMGCRIYFYQIQKDSNGYYSDFFSLIKSLMKKKILPHINAV